MFVKLFLCLGYQHSGPYCFWSVCAFVKPALTLAIAFKLLDQEQRRKVVTGE